MAELRIKIDGESAALGLIPARDVANLLIGIEIAVLRAASVALGRPKRPTGRGEGVIEQAARLRLRAVEEGSVIPVLELPEPLATNTADTLDFEAASLAETAVTTVLDVAEKGEGHPLVARALLDLAESVQVGDRYDALTLDYRPDGALGHRAVGVDRVVVERLRETVRRDKDRVRDDSLVGTLVEADFERNTARLRGQLNEAVTVSFDADLADEIQNALRRPASFQGQVKYDPETMAARSVRLTSIDRGRQLVLGVDPEEFWIERSFAELAAEQGVVPATQPDEIYDADATDDEREAMMAALAELG